MVSIFRLGGRAPLHVLTVLLATAGVSGCGDDSGSDETGSSTSTSTGSTSAGTTAVAESSTGDPSTTTTSTTSGSTTDAESSSSTTGGGSSSSDDGGCEPGTQNCVCDGDACEGELECIDGSCFTPEGCLGKQQDTEPNQDEGAAQMLEGIQCGALSEVDGSTEPDDVDWFTTQLEDLGNKCPKSDGTIAIVTADEDMRVCMYFSCEAGAASVNCGADADDTSPDGLVGCCGTNSVEPDFFCSGVNSNSEVRMRVDNLSANACVDYALAYRVL